MTKHHLLLIPLFGFGYLWAKYRPERAFYCWLRRRIPALARAEKNIRELLKPVDREEVPHPVTSHWLPAASGLRLGHFQSHHFSIHAELLGAAVVAALSIALKVKLSPAALFQAVSVWFRARSLRINGPYLHVLRRRNGDLERIIDLEQLERIEVEAAGEATLCEYVKGSSTPRRDTSWTTHTVVDEVLTLRHLLRRYGIPVVLRLPRGGPKHPRGALARALADESQGDRTGA